MLPADFGVLKKVFSSMLVKSISGKVPPACNSVTDTGTEVLTFRMSMTLAAHL
jgi:hypothetical protein